MQIRRVNGLEELEQALQKLTHEPMKRDDVQYRLSEILVVYTPNDNGFGYYHPGWTIYYEKVKR